MPYYRGVWRAKPLVMHFDWWYQVAQAFIIACGKRDVHSELFRTTNPAKVTCTRCRQTLRFKKALAPEVGSVAQEQADAATEQAHLDDGWRRELAGTEDE